MGCENCAISEASNLTHCGDASLLNKQCVSMLYPPQVQSRAFVECPCILFIATVLSRRRVMHDTASLHICASA